ncbi:MAG TPA: rod shape-determining protein MreC [Acidimicrobiia bacterium]|jgi:rod shape-determining protein MreC
MADSVRGRRRRYILVVMALTALTLATLSQRDGDSGPIGAAGGVAHRVVQPVTDAADSAFGPLHDWWHGFWHHGDVVSQNRKLREELQQALAENSGKTDAIEKLRELDAFFNQTYWSDYKSTGASVVGDSPGNNETTVTINRGSESGVRVGMAVVGVGGLIGTILQTWHGGSKVLLINDPSFGVGARTLLDDRFGTAATDDEGVLRVTFPANGQPKHLSPKIANGDEIVTCGCYGSLLPPGIPIGQVTNVSVAFDASSVRVAVAPTLDLPSLQYVKVILWKPGDPTQASVTEKLAEGAAHPTTTTTTTIPGASTTTSTTTKTAGG